MVLFFIFFLKLLGKNFFLDYVDLFLVSASTVQLFQNINIQKNAQISAYL